MNAEVTVVAECCFYKFRIRLLHILVGVIPHGIVTRDGVESGEFAIERARSALHILPHLVFFERAEAAQHAEAEDAVDRRSNCGQSEAEYEQRLAAQGHD